MPQATFAALAEDAKVPSGFIDPLRVERAHLITNQTVLPPHIIIASSTMKPHDAACIKAAGGKTSGMFRMPFTSLQLTTDTSHIDPPGSKFVTLNRIPQLQSQTVSFLLSILSTPSQELLETYRVPKEDKDKQEKLEPQDLG